MDDNAPLLARLAAAAAVGAVAGAAVAAALLWPARAPEPATAVAVVARTADGGAPEEQEALVAEQLARNTAFMGAEAVSRVRAAFVVVVGAGGVGSHAAVMLARNGVQRLRIVDFDQVTLSSLNRHAAAARADVGRPKVEVLRSHIAAVAPFVHVDARVALFSEVNAAELLADRPDYVLDCIDNIPTKVALLLYCKTHGIPVMCSMGAGAKGDPSRIQISDIADTLSDPLSRTVRTRLKRAGVASGIPCVFSTEIPKVQLVPLDEAQLAQRHEYQVMPDFRLRIMPVLGVIPAMFGNAMAAYVLQHLGGTELEALHFKGRAHLYDKWLQKLRMRERDYYKGSHDVPLDAYDIQLISEEVWRARSAVSRTFDQLIYVRWRRDQPATADNIVLMSTTEAHQHEAAKSPEACWDTAVCAHVERRLAWVRDLFTNKRLV